MDSTSSHNEQFISVTIRPGVVFLEDEDTLEFFLMPDMAKNQSFSVRELMRTTSFLQSAEESNCRSNSSMDKVQKQGQEQQGQDDDDDDDDDEIDYILILVIPDLRPLANEAEFNALF